MSSERKLLIGKVRAVEPIIERTYRRGMGKDAEFDENQTGWKLVMESGVSFSFSMKSKPDAMPGDDISIEISRSKHDGE